MYASTNSDNNYDIHRLRARSISVGGYYGSDVDYDTQSMMNEEVREDKYWGVNIYSQKLWMLFAIALCIYSSILPFTALANDIILARFFPYWLDMDDESQLHYLSMVHE